MRINPLLLEGQEKYLYLLEIELTPEKIAMFSNVRYVLMQGSNTRAKEFSKKLAHKFLGIDPAYFEPKNLTPTTRYSIYKIGNMLSVSHGMGNTSVITLLHELTKLLSCAGNDAVEYIRIGTSGGIGVEPGTVVVTERAFMPNLKPCMELPSLDNNVNIPTDFDLALVKRVSDNQPRGLPFQVVIGNSIAADDFYLGQGRFDGAIMPKYDLEYRNRYFEKIHSLGIKNFEMESTAMAAFCYETEIPATMIAVTLVNRLKGGQITSTPEQLAEFSDRSQLVAINYLLSRNDTI